MSLTSIRVYPDWQQRLRQSQAADRNTWRVTLATFAVSILFLLVDRVSRLNAIPGPLLLDGIVKTLYLTVGLILIPRRVSVQKKWLAGAGLVVITGLLLNAGLTSRISNAADNAALFFFPLVAQAILLIIPGWGILAMVVLRGWKPSGEYLGRIGASIRDGLIAGGAIVVLVYLSRSFAGLEAMPGLPPLPLLVQRVAFAIGLQSVGEELFFRGLVFRYLSTRREMGFWASTCVTLLLNLTVYAIQLPPFLSPLEMAFRLTAASTMIVVNTALFSRVSNLIGPTVSNAVFQVFVFLVTWG